MGRDKLKDEQKPTTPQNFGKKYFGLRPDFVVMDDVEPEDRERTGGGVMDSDTRGRLKEIALELDSWVDCLDPTEAAELGETVQKLREISQAPLTDENAELRAMVQTAADDLQKVACGLDVWDNQRNGNGKLTGPELSPGSAVAGTYGLAAVLREIADPKKGGE